MSQGPVLSAIVVAGPVRERAQKVIDRLCRQTLGAGMELVIVDLVGEEVPALAAPGVALQYLRRPAWMQWGEARAEGVRAARGGIVAFLEDHCFAARTWAEKVAAAHQDPWAAVGYAFTNANPATYMSRASFVLDYGLYAHPAPRGETDRLQSNNISYKRTWLERAVSETSLRLEDLLENDWNVQQALLRAGGRLFLEAEALAMHHNFTTAGEMWSENYWHCRTMGAARVAREGWSLWRRLAQGAATVAAAPAIRAWRFRTDMSRRRGPRPGWVGAVPVLAAGFLASALGEAAGYVAGFGDSDAGLKKALLETERK